MVSTSHTILVADDEDMVRQYLQSFLQMSGYRVLAAKNAMEALELARHSQEPIDLLIADFYMPGPNGPRLAREILKVHPKMKVLLISGSAEIPRDIEGVSDFFFLPKPFTPHRLLHALQLLALGLRT